MRKLLALAIDLLLPLTRRKSSNNLTDGKALVLLFFKNGTGL
jgi:hypothetical protein